MTNANHSAFATQDPDLDPRNATYINGGLTKREYFAAMMMQGLLSGYIATRSEFTRPDEDHIAEESVSYANALIEALNKGGQS
jgi:hypothetical protein